MSRGETRICLCDAGELAPVVEDMAARAAGRIGAGGGLVVAGIVRRGVPIADRVAEILECRVPPYEPEWGIRVLRRGPA